MKRPLIALAAAVLITGCASSPSSGRLQAEDYVRKTPDKTITCFKPADMPSRGQIFRMLMKEGIDPELRDRGEKVQQSVENTYNQEVLLYRVCLDYASGTIEEHVYLQYVEEIIRK